jgi:phosphatidylglycerol---prolipoprotein diacylglyceryl transferase
MLIYPNISSIAFNIGIVKIYWYGIMYLIAFGIAWGLAILRARKANDWSREQINDLIFYCALGVVIGGRVGYTLIYNLFNFISDPLILFKVWKGGMSFHGGLIGILIAIFFFAKKTKKNFTTITDFVAPLSPLGLGAGRIGNFINGELFGRVTDIPWAMIYPAGGPWPRHPSELYEFLLEGILLFIIIWLYSAKPRPSFAVSSLFLICYGLFRSIAEFFRQPDSQFNFIAFGWLTMGQLLSILMVIIGIFFMWRAYSEDKSC